MFQIHSAKMKGKLSQLHSTKTQLLKQGTQITLFHINFSYLFFQVPSTSHLSMANATTKYLRNVFEGRDDDQQDLIPGLPDHISLFCLTSVPPTLLYKVSHSWRKLIYSTHFPPFLSLYVLLSPNSKLLSLDSLQLFTYDPVSSIWTSLPPPPIKFLLRHPSFLSRNLPIQSVTMSGTLVIVSATAAGFLPALNQPLIFDPKLSKWSFGPELASPRRWCVAGTLQESVYVASGIGALYNSKVAKSVEKWNFLNPSNSYKFEEMQNLKDSKFSREAIEAVGFNGKLCMVNVKGDAVKEGAIYDKQSDEWQEMTDDMLWGWRGPAASMAEKEIYTVDEKRGLLMRYAESGGQNVWKKIVESEGLKGSEHIAAGGGRVCVVGRGGNGILVVDVVAAPVKIWVVEVPFGFNVVGLHILPRISANLNL